MSQPRADQPSDLVDALPDQVNRKPRHYKNGKLDATKETPSSGRSPQDDEDSSKSNVTGKVSKQQDATAKRKTFGTPLEKTQLNTTRDNICQIYGRGDITLDQIPQQYPEHLFGPVLDLFIEAEWTATDIFGHIPYDHQNHLRTSEQVNSTRLLHRRMLERQRLMVKKETAIKRPRIATDDEHDPIKKPKHTSERAHVVEQSTTRSSTAGNLPKVILKQTSTSEMTAVSSNTSPPSTVVQPRAVARPPTTIQPRATVLPPLTVQPPTTVQASTQAPPAVITNPAPVVADGFGPARFPRPGTALPADTSLLNILRNYPHHLDIEIFKAFVQRRWKQETIISRLPDDYKSWYHYKPGRTIEVNLKTMRTNAIKAIERMPGGLVAFRKQRPFLRPDGRPGMS